MQILQQAFRVYVEISELESCIKFYEKIQSTRCERRVRIIETGIEAAKVVAAENVDDPAQVLIGITAAGPMGSLLQADWRDGTLAEYTVWPASAVTPVEGLNEMDPAQLAVTMRYIVPRGLLAYRTC